MENRKENTPGKKKTPTYPRMTNQHRSKLTPRPPFFMGGVAQDERSIPETIKCTSKEFQTLKNGFIDKYEQETYFLRKICL